MHFFNKISILKSKKVTYKDKYVDNFDLFVHGHDYINLRDSIWYCSRQGLYNLNHPLLVPPHCSLYLEETEKNLGFSLIKLEFSRSGIFLHNTKKLRDEDLYKSRQFWSQVQLKKHFEPVCIYNILDLFWKWSQQYL